MRYLPLLLLLLMSCALVPSVEDYNEPEIEPEEPEIQVDTDGMGGHPNVTSEAMFVIDMIPHHQEAVDTAMLVNNSNNPKLQDLANRIIKDQQTEIRMMKSWVNNWYKDETYTSQYGNMMPDLETLDAEVRDRVFIQEMIMHHKGAVKMANEVLKLNPRKEVKDFANNVINTQTAETAEMELMLEEY